MHFGRSADGGPGWKVSVGAWLWKRSCSSKLKPPDPLRRIQFSPHSSAELRGDIKLVKRALKPVTLWHFSKEIGNVMFFSQLLQKAATRVNEVHFQKLLI